MAATITRDLRGHRPSTYCFGAAVVLLNVYDAVISRTLISRGGIEGNPIMGLVIHTPWFYVVKITIPLAAICANLWRGEPRRTNRSFAGLAMVFGAVCLWNTTLLWKYT